MKKKLLSMILATAMIATMLVGCGAKEADASGDAAVEAEASAGGSGKVGVAMPKKYLQRLNQDGANMKSELEAAG